MLSRALTLSRFLARPGVAGTVMSQILAGKKQPQNSFPSLETPSKPRFTEPNPNRLLLFFFPFSFPARSVGNVFRDRRFFNLQNDF